MRAILSLSVGLLLATQVAGAQGPPKEPPFTKADVEFMQGMIHHHAQALVMAIHELVTNAAKYGALSTEGGLITIRWRTEQRDDKESRRV